MADAPETTQAALKILVVEDSPTQLEELRFLLEESGFSVVSATNGKEGLASAKANPIDLVISDIVMPGMDGYALCKALRADQTLRDLPVILLTSLADPRDVIQGLESGANNFICKPYDDRALLARVQNVVANQEIRRTTSSEMGISIFFAGQRFFITADRLQILDLLLSTYENAVDRNSDLLRARDELRVLNEQLEARVTERTAALTAEMEERERAEAHIVEQNATLNAILESVDQPVFSLDRQYRYRSFNRAHAAVMKAIYGTDIQIGHSLDEYQTVPEDWQTARGNLDRVLQGETLIGSSYSGDEDLSRRHFEVAHYPIRTDTEEIIGVSIFARDITERERAEEQAMAVLRTAMDGFYVTDAEGRILEVNDAYCRLSGYSRDELLTMCVADVEALETPEDFARHARRIMEVGEDRFETRHRRKDGRTFDLEASVKYLKEAGRLIAFMRDITERKKVQLALEAGEARFRAVVTSAPAAIVVAQADKIVLWNPGAEQLFGYSEGEALGQPPTMLMPEPYLTQHREAVQRFHALGQELLAAKRYEARALRKDGSQCPVQISLAEWRSAQGTFMSAIITDITERERVEEERKTLEEQLRVSQNAEAIGSLAGGIAHDFNNVLSVILGNTVFALEAMAGNDPVRADLLEVKNAAERAAALTRQLLAFSRRQVLQPVVLDLNQATAAIGEMLRRIIGEDIDLAWELAPDLGLILADPGQIDQVLVNLAVNARDAMPTGGKLTIETTNVDFDEEYAARHATVKPGPHVLLAVTDTGCGMDKQTQARIFEPFFTTKEEGKGTGLGLSTVYGIIKQSGGDIRVYSEPGKGTTVTIYLPREMSAMAVGTVMSTVATLALGTETVLVVEDEEAVRNLAARILRAAGYTVLTAASGDEALLTCEAHQGRIHLVLTDVVMPQMSGKEFAARIATVRPGVKVLYMSGYTDNAIVHNGTLDPGTPFIGKPFTRADLTRKVREVLDG